MAREAAKKPIVPDVERSVSAQLRISKPCQTARTRIIVTELPYMVNKANLILKIAELVKLKKIDGITDLRDESDREGMTDCD